MRYFLVIFAIILGITNAAVIRRSPESAPTHATARSTGELTEKLPLASVPKEIPTPEARLRRDATPTDSTSVATGELSEKMPLSDDQKPLHHVNPTVGLDTSRLRRSPDATQATSLGKGELSEKLPLPGNNKVPVSPTVAFGSSRLQF